MNDISYNFKRHIELLNHEKNVMNQGKSFYKENHAEYVELIEYGVAVDAHIFWESRFEVASVMQSFLNQEINAHEFRNSVFGLRRNHIAKCKKFLSKIASGEIKEFLPNKEYYKFKGFLSSLYWQCENFELGWDEEKFYNSIQNGFLKFQKILNEE